MKHVDAPYCAAAWRYLREMAVRHRDIATLVSADDKHKIKVGEPSYPLAAAERGKKVIVGPNQVMAVGDHDFSKTTITPSVNFVVSRQTKFLPILFFRIQNPVEHFLSQLCVEHCAAI